jgi:hypothetical protein
VGLVFIFVKRGKKSLLFCLLALAMYFGLTAPWCVRNYLRSGHYSMSANFGLVSFTKASAFGCLNEKGSHFKRIEGPYRTMLRDLSLIGDAEPKAPEDDWQVNRIPHALKDSLIAYHGLTFAGANDLLGKVAIEGFIRHPFNYAASVGSSFLTMLFEHHDMYPEMTYVLPFETTGLYKFFNRMLRGMVYVSGYLFLLFPLALLYRANRRKTLLVPFFIVCLMYFITAALQIGLTRYTIPWEPLKALCAAYVIETLFIGMKFIDIGTRHVEPRELFQ